MCNLDLHQAAEHRFWLETWLNATRSFMMISNSFLCFLLCRLFEFYGGRSNASLLAKELPPLEGVGPQKCLAFSFDGSKVATGGVVSNNA